MIAFKRSQEMIGDAGSGVPRERPVWWLNPALAALCAGLPGLLLAWHTSDAAFRENWGTPKYFSTHWFVLSLLMLGALVLGAAIGGARNRRSSVRDGYSTSQLERLAKFANFAFWVTVAGYALRGAFGIVHGLSLPDIQGILTLEPGALKAAKVALRPVAGITTLTQLGPVAAACLAAQLRLSPDGRSLRRLVIVCSLALIRAVFYAERLAVIEVALPVIVTFLFLRPQGVRPAGTRSLSRRQLSLVPVVAPLILLIGFSTFEYFRSWGTYYSKVSNKGFVEFNINRLEGYYATPPNNSIVAVTSPSAEMSLPYWSVRFFWDFPGVDHAISDGLGSEDKRSADWMRTLEVSANPEFNNEGSLLLPVADFGPEFALVLWFALGMVLGALYARARGNLAALVSYATAFVGILELTRFIYWALGRAFPAIAACGLYLLREHARRRHDGPIAGDGRIPA